MILSVEKLSHSYGVRTLFKDVTFNIEMGDKIGIIGVNGTGKSTLLRDIARGEAGDGGRITANGSCVIEYLPQNPDHDPQATVLEQVFQGDSPQLELLRRYERAAALAAADPENSALQSRLLELQQQMDSAYAWQLESEAKAVLDQLGISDFNQPMAELSGGQRKRVALAGVLVRPSDLLILDEPTNHMDNETVAWLEQLLLKRKGALLMVTHDRYFLERVVNHITELSRGKLYHYEANYSRYLELKAQRAEMAEASERKRQSILRTEREWIMRGCRARTTKSKDRIERYEALKNQDAPETDDTVQLAAASSRLGKKLIELHDVSKAYGERTVIRDFSYNLLRNDRIGIVGHNGAGKSTLLRLFAGELAPDSGTVDIGTTVKIGHFSQEGRELDLNQRVYDFIHDIGDEVRTDEGTFTAKAMMERFLFPSDLQSVPIGRLSGGERRRLYLLSILMEAPNVLLLDEPTNDLDVMTLSILEDYLQGFLGPILIVSHDRFLLDKLAEQVFEVRDGEVLRYSGNWSDWKAKRKEEEAPAKAEKPKAAQERPRERKLKFSFKEQREFETIDEDLAALEQQIRECEEAQGACGSDYVRLQELQAKQAELEAALEEKTERWMYLTELKEKIDAQ